MKLQAPLSAPRLVLLVFLVVICAGTLCSDALVQGRLRIPSSPSTHSNNSNNGYSLSPILIESIVHQVFDGHVNVIGRLHHLSQSEVSECALVVPGSTISHEDDADSIVLLRIVSQYVAEYFSECQLSDTVVGEVLLDDVAPNTAGFAHHVTQRSPRPLSVVHQVYMAGGGTSAHRWILEHADSGNVQVTITSGDPNEWTQALNSLPFKIWMFFLACHAFSNTAAAFFKFGAFIASHEFPRVVMFVLIPELLGNTLRFLSCWDFSQFQLRLLKFEIMRMMLSATITLSIISTLAIAVMLHEIYLDNAEQAHRKRGRLCSRISIWVESVVLVLDLIHTGYVAIRKSEIVPSSSIATLYTILQVPISFAFVRFGGSAARSLLKQKHSLSEAEKRKREHFSRRVMLSGIAMMANIVVLVAFVMSSAVSTAMWLYIFSRLQATSNAVASFQIAAVKPPVNFTGAVRNKMSSFPKIRPVDSIVLSK